jgi:uncharacterized protein YecE (DUF72 family)
MERTVPRRGARRRPPAVTERAAAGMLRGMVLVGCSGWSYPHWRDPVYGGRAARTWLEQYARRFATTEVNATFYRLPTRRAVESWAADTPAGFVFSVKVSRYLTHVKRLAGAAPGCERLLDRIEPLARSGKLGPLLWQLPPGFRRDDARLESALAALPPGNRHCFEFRHPSWFCPDVMRLLRDAGAALVLADHPQRAFQTLDLTADWTYVRLHHGRRGRRGNYSPTEIEQWAGRIAGWARRGDVYAYFDNDWLGTRSGEPYAVANAEALLSDARLTGLSGSRGTVRGSRPGGRAQ